PAGAAEVAVDATQRVRFREPRNPLTVDATATIVLRDAAGVVLPCSISFTDEDRLVTIVPHAALTAAILHTVIVNGVTDRTGNMVVPVTTTFETQAGPDVVGPLAVRVSPEGKSVPVNAVIVVEFDEPIDPASINDQTFGLQNRTT